MHNASNALAAALVQRLKKHHEIMLPKVVQLPVDQLLYRVHKFIRGLNAENNIKHGNIVIMNSNCENSQLKISSQ